MKLSVKDWLSIFAILIGAVTAIFVAYMQITHDRRTKDEIVHEELRKQLVNLDGCLREALSDSRAEACSHTAVRQLYLIYGKKHSLKGDEATEEIAKDSLVHISRVATERIAHRIDVDEACFIGGKDLSEYGKCINEEIEYAAAFYRILEKALLSVDHIAIERNPVTFEYIVGDVPRSWPMKEFRITASYSKRYHPVLKTFRVFEGINLANECGTPVFSTHDGVVEFSGKDGGWGRVVKINNGRAITTIYGHLSESLVEKGKTVQVGEKIGFVGNTGQVTGCVLSYYISIFGKYVSPQDLIANGI